MAASSPVTAQELREALFTERRPAVKPLFDRHRPVGVRFEPGDQPLTRLQRLLRFFTR